MPNDPYNDFANMTDEQRISLQRRGVYVPGKAGVRVGGYYNPGGTGIDYGSRVGPNYNNQLDASDAQRLAGQIDQNQQPQGGQNGATSAAESPAITAMRQQAETQIAQSRANPNQTPLNTSPIVTGQLFPTVSSGILPGPGGRISQPNPDHPGGRISQPNPDHITAYHSNDQLADMARNDVGGRIRGLSPTIAEQQESISQKLDKGQSALEKSQLDIYTKHRDALWAEEDRARNLSKQEQDLQQGQVTLEKTKYDIAASAIKLADEETMRPIKLAQAQAELKKTQNENISAEQKNTLIQHWQNEIAANSQPLQQQTDVVKSQILTDPNYKPLWKATYEVAARYGVDRKIYYRYGLNRAAKTYKNPMELVRDIGIDHPLEIGTTRGNDVAKWTEDIQTEMDRGIAPDKALENILKQSKISKDDKNYKQTAFDIAAGIMIQYGDDESAVTDFQDAIKAGDALITAAKVVPPLVDAAKNVASADRVKEILTANQQRMNRLAAMSQQARAAGTYAAPYAAELESSVFTGMGLPPVKQDWTTDRIENTVLQYMADKYKSDPQASAQFVSIMTDPANRPPEVQQLLHDIVPAFRAGYKNLSAEQEKEQIKRKAIIEEYANKKQEVYFEPATGTNPGKPHILPEGSLAQLATLSSSEREGYIRDAQIRSERQLSNPAFKRYLTLPDTKRNEIQDFIALANEALKVGILPGADPKTGIIKGEGITIAGEKNIHSLTELELRARQYINIYGLQDSVVLEKPTMPNKTTPWYMNVTPLYIFDKLMSGKGEQPSANTPTNPSTIKMKFPDGKVKLVPTNEQQRYAAMGGQVTQ